MCNWRLTAGIMSRIALFRALCVKGGTHPFIFIEVLSPDTGSEERVALQVEDLAAISFRDAGVSNQHRMYLKRSDTVGQPPSAEIWVSKMPSLKAKKLRILFQEKVLLEL